MANVAKHVHQHVSSPIISGNVETVAIPSIPRTAAVYAAPTTP